MLGPGEPPPPPSCRNSTACLPPHRRPSVSAPLRCTAPLGVGLFLGGGLSYLVLEAGAWVGSGCFCTQSCDWRQGD